MNEYKLYIDGPGPCWNFQYAKYLKGGPTCLQWNFGLVNPIKHTQKPVHDNLLLSIRIFNNVAR